MSGYDGAFFGHLDDGSTRSAQILVPLVTSIVPAKSVLDIGCGTGSWLKVWSDAGVADIVGVDGPYVPASGRRIPESAFLERDLEHEVNLSRSFDLAMSVEVAEHVSHNSSANFVASLTNHADVVLFSAAIPGQGGTHHINEQWPSYWAPLFEKRGYRPYDMLRAQIWQDAEIAVWYRQNLMFFATDEAAEKYKLTTSSGPLDLVHPDQFSYTSSLTAKDHIRAQFRATRIAGGLASVSRRLRAGAR